MIKKLIAKISFLLVGICMFHACGFWGNGTKKNPIFDIPDFIVEVEDGRDPIVLQLINTQISL